MCGNPLKKRDASIGMVLIEPIDRRTNEANIPEPHHQSINRCGKNLLLDTCAESERRGHRVFALLSTAARGTTGRSNSLIMKDRPRSAVGVSITSLKET